MDINIPNLVISIIGGSASALLVAAFLGKSLVSNLLKKDIEKYKTDLSEKVEKIKKKLEIYVHEQQTALTRIDKQSSDALIAVFNSIRKWEKVTSDFLEIYPKLDYSSDDSTFDFFYPKATLVVNASEKFKIALEDNEIYFDKDFFSEIYKFYLEATMGVTSMMKIIDFCSGNKPIPSEMKNYLLDSREELYEKFHNKTSPMKDKIVTEFRLRINNAKNESNKAN